MLYQLDTNNFTMENEDILDLDLGPLDDNTIHIKSVTVDKFIILFVFSFGLYGVWWMYKAWSFIKAKDRLSIMPAARAIFAIFFLSGLFEKILRFAKVNGYTKSYSSVGLFVMYIILSICNRLPPPYFFISFFAFLPFFQPIDAFNKSIELSPFYSLDIKKGFSPRQLALIVVGGLLWALMLVGLFFIDEGSI